MTFIPCYNILCQPDDIGAYFIVINNWFFGYWSVNFCITNLYAYKTVQSDLNTLWHLGLGKRQQYNENKTFQTVICNILIDWRNLKCFIILVIPDNK